jgi:hypothetical protein
MKTTNPIDAARIELLLSDLRLPAIKLMLIMKSAIALVEGVPSASGAPTGNWHLRNSSKWLC